MRKKNTASNSQKYVKKGSEQKGLCQPSPELLVDWKNRCCSLKKRHTWGGKKNPTSLKFMYRSLARYLFTPECWEQDEDSIDFVTLLSSVSQWDTLNRCIKHLFSLGLVKIKCCASAVQPYRILERNTLNSYIPPFEGSQSENQPDYSRDFVMCRWRMPSWPSIPVCWRWLVAPTAAERPRAAMWMCSSRIPTASRTRASSARCCTYFMTTVSSHLHLKLYLVAAFK